MGYAATSKLNIFPDVTAWGGLPLAFLGVPTKDENGQELKSRFINADGKKLLNNEAFILAIIRSMTKSFGKCTLTYEGWTALLGKCDKTIWACLKDLEERGLIEKLGQSTYRYKIREDIEQEQALAEEAAFDDNYLPLVYFIFETWFMKRKKKIGKEETVILETIRHFSPTAILILFLLMRHNNNPKKSNDYYIAGEVQLANTLNKPQSMVSTGLDELIKADFVHRNYIHVYYNVDGSVSHYGKVTEGKGVNKYCRSCFILDDKIRRIKLADTKENKKVEALIKAKLVSTENDGIIQDLMTYLKSERKITDKDRRKVAQWFEWGFDTEMIKAAAQIANGRASDAVRYVHGVLKNWYSEGILTVADLHKAQPKKNRSVLEQWRQTAQMNAERGKDKPKDNTDLRIEIERHYYDLRHKAEEAAEKALKRATSDAVYGGIRKQLNELGIKLAFAEIRDKAAAEQISAEIKELEERGDKRLSELAIDKDDFKPHFSCTICNDTGYNTHGSPCKCMKELIEKLTNKKG